MSSSISNLQAIPKYHPLYKWLLELPSPVACDPNPDWVEQGSQNRYIFGFRSSNCNARLNRLHGLIKNSKLPVSIMTQSFGPHQAYMIFYINEARPYDVPPTSSVQPDLHMSKFPLVIRKEDCEPIAPKDEELPGAQQMETYE